MYYHLFYRQNKQKVWVATILLSLPLYFRAILDLIGALTGINSPDKYKVDGNEENTTPTAIYDLFLFFIGDALPAVT